MGYTGWKYLELRRISLHDGCRRQGQNPGKSTICCHLAWISSGTSGFLGDFLVKSFMPETLLNV
jgi:hypothetical protein